MTMPSTDTGDSPQAGAFQPLDTAWKPAGGDGSAQPAKQSETPSPFKTEDDLSPFNQSMDIYNPPQRLSVSRFGRLQNPTEGPDPNAAYLKPSEVFRQLGGNPESLSAGFRTDKNDPQAQALAGLPPIYRTSLLQDAGNSPDAAAQISRDIDSLFAQDSRQEFTTRKALQTLSYFASAGNVDVTKGFSKSNPTGPFQFAPINMWSQGLGDVALGGSEILATQHHFPTPGEAAAKGESNPTAARFAAQIGAGVALGIPKVGGALGTETGAPASPFDLGAGAAFDEALVRPAFRGLGAAGSALADVVRPERAPAVSGAGYQTIRPPIEAEQTFGLRPVESVLNKTDQLANVMRRTVGRAWGAVEDSKYVQPLLREAKRATASTASQGVAFGKQADYLLKSAFQTDEAGRITSLAGLDPRFPDGPTIPDLAAKFKTFEPHLAPNQLATANWLKNSLAPYKGALESLGVEVGTRADIEDGGFYVPRGIAELDALPEVRKIYSGGVSRGLSAGFLKEAPLPTAVEGITKGFSYNNTGAVLTDFVRRSGAIATDRYVANGLKSLVAEEPMYLAGKSEALDKLIKSGAPTSDILTELSAMEKRGQALVTRQPGEPIASSPAQRLQATGWPDRIDALRSKVSSTRDTLIRQIASEKAAWNQANRLGVLTGGTEERYGMAAGKAEAATGVRSPEFAKMTGQSENLDAALNDAGVQMQILEREVGALQRAAGTAEEKAALKTVGIADTGKTFDSLRQAYSDLNAEYQRVKASTSATPRGESPIGAPGLMGYSFPDALARAANNQIRDAGAIQGRGALLIRGMNTFNSFVRGVRTVGDASVIGLISLPILADDPASALKGYQMFFQSLTDADVFGKYLEQQSQRALSNGRMTPLAFAKTGDLHFGNADEFTGGLPLRQLTPIKQMARAWMNTGNVLRFEIADHLLEDAISGGRFGAGQSLDALAKDGTIAKIGRIANITTGHTSVDFPMGNMLLFAPRFFTSRAQMLGEAAMGLNPNSNIAQGYALRSLLKLYGMATMAAVGVNDAQGKSTDFRPLVNGRWNSNFLAMDYGGRKISLLGASMSPVAAMTVMAQGSHNPIDALRGSMSPLAAGLTDLIKNQTFNGERIYGKGGNPGKYAMESLLPFSYGHAPTTVQQGIQQAQGGIAPDVGRSLAVTLADLGGFRATPNSLTDDRNGWLSKHPVDANGKALAAGDANQVTDWNALGPRGQSQLNLSQPDLRGIQAAHPAAAETTATTQERQSAYDLQAKEDAKLQGGLITGKQWHTNMANANLVQSGIAQAKADRDLTGQRPIDNANDQALADYLKIGSQFQQGQEFDVQGYEAKVGEFMAGLAPDQAKFVLDNLHRNATDTEQRYYDLQRTLRDANYYSEYKTLPEYQKLPQAYKDKWEEYLKAKQAGSDKDWQSDPANAQYQVLTRTIPRAEKAAQVAYREANPRVDQDLALFYDKAPASNAAQADIAKRLPSGSPQLQALVSAPDTRINLNELRSLRGAGINSLQDLVRANPADIAQRSGGALAQSLVVHWQQQAQRLVPLLDKHG